MRRYREATMRKYWAEVAGIISGTLLAALVTALVLRGVMEVI